MNIYNQCLDVDLVSPTYDIDIDLVCHRPPDYKVRAGDTMRSAFIIDEHGFIARLGTVSYGILIYRLQRKRLHESTETGEGISSATHLLVVWEISISNKLYADVLLVKHDKRLDWNKNDLRKLCDKNINQFMLCPDSSTTETWLLNDNVALMITSEIMNEDRILDITISEVERNNCTRTPAHIDPDR
jgi:hypothetical protein